jgi:hypothetical protein
MKKDIKAQRRICKGIIEKSDFDPCSIMLVSNSDKEWRDQKE